MDAERERKKIVKKLKHVSEYEIIVVCVSFGFSMRVPTLVNIQLCFFPSDHQWTAARLGPL